MKRLSGIISKIKFSSFKIINWPRRIILFYAVFIISLPEFYCFRENVLQKVEVYQSEEISSDVNLFYIDVISVFPEINSTEIPTGSNIVVEFNDNIDMATVTPLTFTITPPIAGVFSYDGQMKTVTFNPSGAFLISTTYMVNLTTGIKNVNGEQLAADHSWSFTTAAIQPEIYFNPPSPLVEIMTGGSYDFGSEDISITRSAVFTIGNSGTANLNISSINIVSADFTISGPVPGLIAIGATDTVTVNFLPGSAGIKNTVMTILSDDSDEGSFTVNLTGKGLAVPEPEIQTTYSGIILTSTISVVDFGTVPIGDTGMITLVMHNIGTAGLDVTDVAVVGNNPEFFSSDFMPVPTTIPAGSTKSFNIYFSPTGNGSKKAVFLFQNNDVDEPIFEIQVKGRGV